ncbi:MAG: DUF4167 domain-containing protein [Magnetospirillum sp.]|nr:DUF4167 domain-containing protein [Magnetospirillum sp.]
MNNPKQRSRGRGNNGGNPNRINHGGGGHGGHSSHGGGGHQRNINIRSQVFDSNGPEGRIRGNAHQVMEKYLALARDASSQGDRHAAENFYQHAEHYFRLINAYNQNNGQRRPQNLPTPAEDQAEVTGEDEDGEERRPMAADEMQDEAAPQAEMTPEPAAPEPVPTPEPVVEAAPQAEEEAPARPVRRRRRPAAAAEAPAEQPASEGEPVLI